MNRPIGALIIAVLVFLRGLWGVMTGLLALGIGGLAFFVSGLTDPGAVAIYWAIASLVIGVLTLAIAYGLFTLRPWAWMWAVLLLVLGLIIDLLIMFTGGGTNWISMIIAVIVLIYMLTPGVRQAFMDS